MIHPNDVVYYVLPSVFRIIKVKITGSTMDEGFGLLYLDEHGWALLPTHLFFDLQEAKKHAFNSLKEFYTLTLKEIDTNEPKFQEVDNDRCDI